MSDVKLVSSRESVCVQGVCVCHLAEGQTVLVLVFVFDLEVIQRFALGRSLAQGTQQLDITGRQETMASVELAMIPVVIHLASQDDDVTLGKLEIARFFSLVGIEGFTARQRWDVLKNMHTRTNTYCTSKALFNETSKQSNKHVLLLVLEEEQLFVP